MKKRKYIVEGARKMFASRKGRKKHMRSEANNKGDNGVLKDVNTTDEKGAEKAAKKFNKKKLRNIVIVCAILALCVAFVCPRSLGSGLSVDDDFSAHFEIEGVEKDKNENVAYPVTETTEEKVLTTEQKEKVLELLDKHPYYRTIGTVLAKGSMKDEYKTVKLKVYDAETNTLTRYLSIGEGGQMLYAGHTYRMWRAEKFYNEMEEILNE